MLAKAAASASTPMVKGSVYLDWFDAKYIHFMATIWELEQLIHVCKLLLKTIALKKDDNVVPLTNFLLALRSSSLFNFSPVIAKRMQLLSQFKQCKLNEINPPLSTAPVSLRCALLPIEEEVETYLANIYNKSLQMKLLNSLLAVSNNALQICRRNANQLLMERNANRPADATGKPVPLDQNCIKDLLMPHELTAGLDLMVKISDSKRDTSHDAFCLLNLNVLQKFRTKINESCLPPLRGYYTSIMKFSKSKSISLNSGLVQLPYWQQSMHRIYALSLRIKLLIDVIQAFLRHVYIPNRQYLHDNITQLHSSNLFEYKKVLNDVELVCNAEGIDEELNQALEIYSKQGSSFQVQSNNIIAAYNSMVLNAVNLLRSTMKTVDLFTVQWKFIEDNKKQSKLIEVESSILHKMVDEKLLADKLRFSETENEKLKQREQERLSKQKQASSFLSAPNGSARGSFSSSNSTSTFSSANSSPLKSSPLKLSRTSSISRSDLSKQSSRRGSVPENLASSSTLSRSPSVSRKSSTVKTRARSSSLQSSFGSASNGPDKNLRTNSLQADSKNTQRIVQNAYNKVSSSFNEKRGLTTTPTKQASFLRSKSPSPNVSQQSLLKEKSRSTLERLKDVDELKENFYDLELNDKTLIVSRSSLSELSCESENEEESKHKNSIQPEIIVSNSDAEVIDKSSVVIKKVRFTGVPPMSMDENPEPKRRGWYKKPSTLHYPPPPPQYSIQKFKQRQEGLAFRTHLGVNQQGDVRKINWGTGPSPVQNSSSKIVSKLKDRLAR